MPELKDSRGRAKWNGNKVAERNETARTVMNRTVVGALRSGCKQWRTNAKQLGALEALSAGCCSAVSVLIHRRLIDACLRPLHSPVLAWEWHPLINHTHIQILFTHCLHCSSATINYREQIGPFDECFCSPLDCSWDSQTNSSRVSVCHHCRCGRPASTRAGRSRTVFE